MQRDIPSPGDHSVVFDSQRDPRAASMISQLRKSCNLDKRVQEILSSHPQLTNEEKTAFDVKKLEQAAARPSVKVADLDHVIIEVHEINGHLVYYIQPKKSVPLDLFLDKVVMPSMRGVWDQFGVRGWLESFPESGRTEVWGVQIRELSLNGLNDSYFQGVIPKLINDLIGKIVRGEN